MAEDGEMPDSSAGSGPQVEDGYTRYANELLEALCKLKCRNIDRRLIDAVARLTYGIYGRKKARIENTELADMTGLTISKVCEARKRLVEMNILIITARGNSRALTYGINKHYRTWKELPPAVRKPTRGNGAPAGGTDTPAGGTSDTAGGNDTFIKENNNKPKRKNGGSGKPDPPKRAPLPPPNLYKDVIDYLNLLVGTKFSPERKETRASIRARWRAGASLDDFKAVIDVKTDQWLGDPKATAWLRPSTLFRPTNFENYLQEAMRSKSLAKSEKTKIKERRYKIAAGILRESGQEACLRYCIDNKIDAEDFKQWISKLTEN
jgi:phage replication O-like protein O